MKVEYNICALLEDNLKRIYGLQNEKTSYLFKYVSMRAACAKNSRKVKRKDLFDFIISELNLSRLERNNKEVLVYKEREYSLFDTYMELMDNFEFRTEVEGGIEDYKEELEEVFKKGYSKAQKYKKSASYKNHLALERLKVLNRNMGANPISTEGIEEFETDTLHNPFKRTLEETLISVIETNKVDFSTSYITENQLEEYISKKLELIEDGLKLIKRQFEVSGGTIDILAKDKNGTICIVELKIAEDKSIVWQVLHYPLQIKKIYNVQEVRMITVSPNYSPHILSALKMSKNIECYDYNITTEGKEISELKLRKVV